MIHYATAALLCSIAFLVGLIAMGVTRNERFARLAAKLAAKTIRVDELTDEVFERSAECKKLRDRLRGEIRVVRGDGPKGAA